MVLTLGETKTYRADELNGDDVIRLGGKKKKKWATIKEQRERAKKFPMPLRILASPITTAVLGTTLASLLYPAAALSVVKGVGKALVPKTAKGMIMAGITVPTAYGLLKASPKARALAKKMLDPREAVKRGEYIAGIVEDPEKIKAIGEKEGWWETVKTAAKKGGKYGVVAAGIVGGLALGKKYLEKRKEKKELELLKAPSVAQFREPVLLGATAPMQVGVGGIPIGAPVEPITAEKRVPAIHNIIQIQVEK